MYKLAIFFLMALFVTMFASIIGADHHSEHNSNHGGECQECGPGGTCQNVNDQWFCRCTQKTHKYVEDANPRCQPLADIGDKCQYDEQCTNGKGGDLSYCNKKMSKCECQDKGRQYAGVCYSPTSLNGTCFNDLQCKAFIQPEEHVRCTQVESQSNFGVCKCDENVKCTHSNSGTNFDLAKSLTLTVVGFMAMNVIV